MSVEVDTELPETVAELLHQLGDIPPERLIINPPFGAATEADVLRYESSRRKRLCELMDGILVEKPMGYVESVLALAIGSFLNQHVLPRDLGLVAGESGMVRLFPGNIRMPDVAFASWERFPDRQIPDEPIVGVVPELVVEVLSKSNTKREMERKRREYFSAGVRLVWEVDPRVRTVSVYVSPENPVVLSDTEELTGGEVLPEFRLRLSDLFAVLVRRG